MLNYFMLASSRRKTSTLLGLIAYGKIDRSSYFNSSGQTWSFDEFSIIDARSLLPSFPESLNIQGSLNQQKITVSDRAFWNGINIDFYVPEGIDGYEKFLENPSLELDAEFETVSEHAMTHNLNHGIVATEFETVDIDSALNRGTLLSNENYSIQIIEYPIDYADVPEFNHYSDSEIFSLSSYASTPTTEGQTVNTTITIDGATYPVHLKRYAGKVWLLTVNHVGTSGWPMHLTFKDTIVSGYLFRTQTQNATTHPVLPSFLFGNDSAQWLYESGNSSWNSSVGSVYGNTLPELRTVTQSTPFVATAAVGGNRNFWGNSAGWNINHELETTTFSLWVAWGNGGLGGGAGVCAGQTNPFFGNYSANACHYNQQSNRLYLLVQ